MASFETLRDALRPMLTRIASYATRHHVAMFALFFALGGTSFAAANAVVPSNSVGTKQVINGSLQATDLSNKARSALKGNKGPQGRAGTQGAQGPMGATGAQGPQGPQGLRGEPGQSATTPFAAVDADGTVTKSGGATLVSHALTGSYRISFDADITNCVYVGTAGQDAGNVSGDYNLYASRTGAHTVNVAIADGADNSIDRPFYLAVLC
jgi:hypothetical protein